jgi:hypothetical protein
MELDATVIPIVIEPWSTRNDAVVAALGRPVRSAIVPGPRVTYFDAHRKNNDAVRTDAAFLVQKGANAGLHVWGNNSVLEIIRYPDDQYTSY